MAGSAFLSPPVHVPVLLQESVLALRPRSGGRYLDGTFGGGGHTAELLRQSAPEGVVLALDLDPEAIKRAGALAASPEFSGRLFVEQCNFIDVKAAAERHDLLPLDGILLDLGMSSFQLDEAARGFGFMAGGPLDMRFDPGLGTSAAELIDALQEDALAAIIWQYGEDHRSRVIAREIVKARASETIETTSQLAQIVERAVGGRRGSRVHPATKTFQALRIAVNDELAALSRALPSAVEVLAPGGRLAIISFHSLEDRIVKQYFRQASASCVCPPEQPVCTCGHRPELKLVGKAIKASLAEQTANPRSRSAILRVAERIETSNDVGASGVS